jgi:hypothetical protein
VTQPAEAPGGWFRVQENGASVIFPVRELVLVRIEGDET